MESTKQLAEELGRLPAQAAAAVRILEAMQDPNVSAARLAGLIELDPVLSARVLRLANAPYHGLARRVSSPSRAVVLLGLSTVRAIAAGAAASVLSDEHWSGQRLWTHAVGVAAGSAVVGRHVPGVCASDAFSAGLLHDLGTGLFLRRDHEPYAALVGGPDPVPAARLEAVELHEFGLTHAAAGAQVFESWRFPPQLVRAVAGHHQDPLRVSDTLTRVVIAGEAFAVHLNPETTSEEGRDLDQVTDALDLAPATAARLLRELRRELESCAALLRARR